MKILLTRTGSPLYCDDTKATSPKGEADTLPFFRWLINQGHDVRYFGRVVNPENSPGQVYSVPLNGVDEWSSEDDIRERCEDLIEEVRLWGPVCCLDMFGYSPTWSTPKNPRFSSVQAAAIRYSLPQLLLMHELNLPRVGVVTDPKCYKRDLEMASIWPNVRPVAVLSQEQTTIPKRMLDKQFMIHAVNAGCEFWHVWDWEPYEWLSDKRHDVVQMGHAHLKTSRIKNDGRQDIYEAWWCDREELNDPIVYGTGWEGQDVPWGGTLPTLHDVRQVMQKSYGGPMIPQKYGFNSTKPRIHALSGSCPFIYGNDPGNPFTYDVDERILPIDHPGRIMEEESLAHYMNRFGRGNFEELRLEVLDKTEPDFSKLIDCIAALEAEEDTDTDAWRQEFGGYQCLQ